MTERPSATRGFGYRAATVAGTALVLAVAAGGVYGMTSAIAMRADAVEQTAETAPALVRTAILDAQAGYTVQRAFPGQVEPARTADLSFEAGGTVADIFVDEGDMVSRGDVLARLDTRRLEAGRDRLRATRDATEARAELARRTLDRQARLEGNGFASAQRLDEVRLSLVELQAGIAEIDAQLADVAVQLDLAVLRAPFAGRIGARVADEGMILGAGNPVVTLLEGAAATFRVGLAPTLAGSMRPGQVHSVTIDGAARPATVTAVRPDLDPATRTRIVLLELDGEMPAFRQTGTLTLDQRIETDGFRVPLTALREGVRGLWTLPVVETGEDGAHRIALAAVELIHADAATAYVNGTLRDGARIVTDGTHRLVPGQPVRIEDGGAVRTVAHGGGL